MKKVLLFLVVAVALVCGGFYLLVGDPEVFYNNQKMDSAMLHAEIGKKITLDQITMFEWDEMYSFKHTMTKSEIEQVLGFESAAIKEPTGDTFIQVVFVKEGKVVCNLSGVYTSLGYNVIFNDPVPEYHKILNSDKVEFEVKDIENVIRFIQVDKGIIVPPDKQMGIY
ncbi:MAG: hypothetical protein IJB96_08885 [Lachnospira sp.]|nr:hypothetical protein [Lachnospira sp.]